MSRLYRLVAAVRRQLKWILDNGGNKDYKINTTEDAKVI